MYHTTLKCVIKYTWNDRHMIDAMCIYRAWLRRAFVVWHRYCIYNYIDWKILIHVYVTLKFIISYMSIGRSGMLFYNIYIVSLESHCMEIEHCYHYVYYNSSYRRILLIWIALSIIVSYWLVMIKCPPKESFCNLNCATVVVIVW